MAVRKLTTIHHLEELDLKRETLRTLKAMDVNVEELVAMARNDIVWQTYSPDYSKKEGDATLTAYSCQQRELVAKWH